MIRMPFGITEQQVKNPLEGIRGLPDTAQNLWSGLGDLLLDSFERVFTG